MVFVPTNAICQGISNSLGEKYHILKLSVLAVFFFAEGMYVGVDELSDTKLSHFLIALDRTSVGLLVSWCVFFYLQFSII